MEGISELVELITKVVDDWKTAGVLAGLVALVNVLVALTKLPVLARFIKPSWRPWIALGLGALGAGVAAAASGAVWWKAILTGVVAGLGALGTHEVWSTMAPSERDKREARAAVTAALTGREEEVKERVDALKTELDKAVAMPNQKDRLKALASWSRSNPPPRPR